MKKKFFAVALATTMALSSAMTAMAADASYYSFDSDAGSATLTGAKSGDVATLTAPVIEDGKLVLNGTYGLKLPETITGDTYTISFKVNYNAVTACTATVGIFASTETPQNWISLGYGWKDTVTPGIWARNEESDKWADIFSETTLETGKEYTFTYVVDNLAASVFVDGEQVATGTLQSVVGAPIYVGVNAWDTPANCTIDDLVVVNGVATSDVSGYIDSTEDETPAPEVGEGETTEPETEATAPSTPSADTKNPSVDTDNPSVDTKNPSVDTDNPSVDTKNPSVDTDNPSVDTNKPSIDGGSNTDKNEEESTSATTGSDSDVVTGVTAEGLKAGQTLVARKLTADSVSDAVKKFVAEQLKGLKVAYLDLSILEGGVEVQPDGTIKVTVPVSLLEGFENAKVIKVFHEHGNEPIKEIAKCDVVDGKITFSTDKFSTFIFADWTGVEDETETTVPPTGGKPVPTTGDAAPIAVLAAIATLAGAGVVVSRKKRA